MTKSYASHTQEISKKSHKGEKKEVEEKKNDPNLHCRAKSQKKCQ